MGLRSVACGPGVKLGMTLPQLWSTVLPPTQGRCLKVSLRNRHNPGSPTPEQWVLSATPFRCMARHHGNHPIIESRSGPASDTLLPGSPPPSAPPYGVCGSGSCCQKKAPLCLQGMKDIWFSTPPFLSTQLFSQRAAPCPQKVPLDARTPPRLPSRSLGTSFLPDLSSQSISAFTSNSWSHWKSRSRVQCPN